VRWWDASYGRELARLSLHKMGRSTWAVHAVAFSPDGRTVAAGGWGTAASLWDPKTGQQLWHVDGVSNFVAFSPDGRKLLCGSGQVLDVATGKPVRFIGGLKGSFNSAAFAPDGRSIVGAGKDGIIGIWDAATGRQDRQLRGDKVEVPAV